MIFHRLVLAAAVALTGVAVLTPACGRAESAEGPTWFFNAKNQRQPATFGLTSGLSAESVPVFGRCDKEIVVSVYFKRSTLAQLVLSGAHPQLNFILDGEGRKFTIDRLDLNEAGPQLWTPTISGLNKEFFERLAVSKTVFVQLLGDEQILETYKQPLTDQGRKEAMLRVARECF